MTNTRSQGVRKSLFPAKTTIDSTNTLDYVAGGVNYKITFDDFKDALGVTGIIQQDGAVTGTPVLDIQGSVNNIRNLENGPGVFTEVSAENGITVKHNFTFDSIGVPLSSNPTDASPVMKSLVQGTGISVDQGVNTITISATGVTTPTNEIIINQESDFPEQDASTITLTGGNRYKIGASFSTAKGFIVNIATQAVVFAGENQFGPIVTYTGAGDMFTITDCTFIIHDVQIDSPNANQTFNHSVVATPPPIFILFQYFNTNLISTPKVGTFDSITTTQFTNSASFNADDGIQIIGSGQLILAINEFALFSSNAAFKFLDIGSTVIGNIELSNAIAEGPAGSAGIVGAANNANVPANVIATVTGGNFAGVTNPLVGITEDDFRWNFSGNSGIKDTRPDALISIEGNATETVISASSTDGSNAVKMAGTWTVEEESHFTSDATGRITYDGEVSFPSPIDFNPTLLMASGSNNPVGAYLAINGVVKTETRVILNITSSQPDVAPLIWQHTFENGDYVEVWLENRSTTTNIIGQQSVGRVN